MSRAGKTRALAALAALLSVVLLVACGSDDDGQAAQSTPATTKAATTTAASVAFAPSPEEGLPTDYPEPRHEPKKIGLLNPNRATEVLTVIFDSAKAEVKRVGGTSIELDAKLDPNEQITQFEQLLNAKVDAIGMVPMAGPQATSALLKKAAQAKVPVIGFDITPGKPGQVPGWASQIWQQRDRLAYLQVKAAAESLPKGSEIALIGFAIPAPLFPYTAARQRYWAGKFGLKVVDQADAKSDGPAPGAVAAEGLIARHPNLEGILGYNDEPAIGAALAARAAGRRDLKTFGITAGSLGRGAIKNGRLTASAYSDGAEMGRLLARGLYDAAEAIEIPPVVLAGTPYTVTKENVDVEPEEAARQEG